MMFPTQIMERAGDSGISGYWHRSIYVVRIMVPAFGAIAAAILAGIAAGVAAAVAAYVVEMYLVRLSIKQRRNRYGNRY